MKTVKKDKHDHTIPSIRRRRLGRVIAAWRDLPSAIQTAILALIVAARSPER